jgi:hypothetical protein
MYPQEKGTIDEREKQQVDREEQEVDREEQRVDAESWRTGRGGDRRGADNAAAADGMCRLAHRRRRRDRWCGRGAAAHRRLTD